MKSFEKIKSPILTKVRQQSQDSRITRTKVRSNNEKNEKTIEDFSKFSEILAETQTDIFELFENKQKLDAKPKLWEIFTNLNNKIWLLVFKPGTSSQSPPESLELKDLKSRISEANMLIQDLKFKLQAFQSTDPNQLQLLQNELKTLKKENQKMIEELSSMSKDFIFKENKISELKKLNLDLRNELNTHKTDAGKEIALLNLRLAEITKEKELLDDWKNQTDEDLLIVSKYTQEKLFTDKENEDLLQKVSLLEKNYRIIQENHQDVQEKFWAKCKAFDALTAQFKELQVKELQAKEYLSKELQNKEILAKELQIKENFKEKHKKSASLTKASTRSVTPCQQLKAFKKASKGTRLCLSHQKSFEIFPVVNKKDLLMQSETKAVLLQNQIDNYFIEKTKLEKLLSSEEQGKSELLNSLNKLQLEILNLKNELNQKNMKSEELERICNEGKEKIKDLILQLKEINDQNIFLIKENHDLTNELDSAVKKLLNSEKNHEKCLDSQENWKKLQENYIQQIETLQHKSRVLVDKDSLNLQNELKYAKVLIMKKEAEIGKLVKEKEILNQEIQSKTKHKGNFEDDPEEKIKNLENHVLNLKSLIEVKEKIIREYGSNRPKLTENSCNVSQISKVTSEKSIESAFLDHKANPLVHILKTEKENLSNYVGKLESQLSECEVKIAELRKEISSKEDQILVLNTNLSLEKSTVYFIQEESSKVKSKNSELKSQIKELNSQIASLRTKLEGLILFNTNEVSLKYFMVRWFSSCIMIYFKTAC